MLPCLLSVHVSFWICFLLSFIWVLFLEMFSHSVLTLSCMMVTVISIIQTKKGRLREFRQLVLSTQVGTSLPEDEAKAGLWSESVSVWPQSPFCALSFWPSSGAHLRLMARPQVQDRQQLIECLCQSSLPPKVSMSWLTCLSWFIDTIDTILKSWPRITQQNCKFERIRNILWKHISFWL